MYLAAQPIPAWHIICHTALKREEKREWRRIASPSPPAHQVRRLNLKHPGLILGGSTGVSLNAHPAHRQPSTSPSARYWAEGPAEGQASGSTLEGHPWDALVRGREGTSIHLYPSTLAGCQSSPVSPIRPYHRLQGANRATPSLCRRKTLTVQAVRTACWRLVLPSLRWRLQRAEVPPFPPSLFFLSLRSVDTSSRSLPGLRSYLSLSFPFPPIH